MAVIGIADVLSSDSDSTGQCVLALDQYETDYSMIRDCSTLLLDGTRLDRYSCKDPWKCAAMQDDMDREFSSRKRYIPFYDTWIAGQVHEVWPAYRHRVLHDSQLLNCYVVVLKCPDSSDDRNRLFFEEQVAALEGIMHRGGEWADNDNSKIDTWIGPIVDGIKTIEVVLTDEQLCFWGGAWAFSPDQHLKMEVRLHRDDGFQGKLQTYTIWLQRFAMIDFEEQDTEEDNTGEPDV